MVAVAAKAAPTSAIRISHKYRRSVLSPVEGRSRSHKCYSYQSQISSQLIISRRGKKSLPQILLTEALAGFGIYLARLDVHLHRFLIIISRHFNGVVIDVHIDGRVDARIVRVADFVVLGG